MRPRVSVLALTHNHVRYAGEMIEGVLSQEAGVPVRVGNWGRRFDGWHSRRHRPVPAAGAGSDPAGISREEHRGHAEHGPHTGAMHGRVCSPAGRGRLFDRRPRSFKSRVDLLDAHPETAICGHRVRLQCEGGSPGFTTPYDLATGFFPDMAAGFYALEDLLRSNFIPNSSAMFRNGLIPELPGWFCESFGQDWPLLLLNARRGNIALLDEIMGTYRLQANSLTLSQGEIFRLQGVVKLLDAFAGDCEKKYQPVIRAKQFQSAWWLSKLLLADGKIGEARRWYPVACRYPRQRRISNSRRSWDFKHMRRSYQSFCRGQRGSYGRDAGSKNRGLANPRTVFASAVSFPKPGRRRR